MKAEQLFGIDAFGQIRVPFGDDPFDLGENVQHFLRWVNADRAFVVRDGASFDVSLFLEIGEVSGHAAFVDANVLGELFLRHTGMMADGENVAVVTGAEAAFLQLVLSVDSLTTADHVDFSHKGLLSCKRLRMQRLRLQLFYHEREEKSIRFREVKHGWLFQRYSFA